ncbi:MAG TPA: hypothetical protein VGC41_23760 [Kofleriaceae bacterium]
MRFVFVLGLVGRMAAADGISKDGSDTLFLDADGSAPVPWETLGGSIAYEHHFADSRLGMTMRMGAGAAWTTLTSIDAPPMYVFGLVGLRHHWDKLFFNIAIGYGGWPRSNDRMPDRWISVPGLELGLGTRVRNLDLGIDVSSIGVLSLRVGIAI